MGQDRSKLRWNGWGWTAHVDEMAQREDVWSWLANEFGMPALLATPARSLSEVALPPTKLPLEHRLAISSVVGADQLRDSPDERAFHSRGRSYRDLILLRSGDMTAAPDAVVYPRAAEEVHSLLAIAAERNIIIRPFGGGTALPELDRSDSSYVVALDLSDMDRIISIDSIDRTAEIEAGIYGPALEAQLNTKGFTIKHSSPEFEFSTLGGWIANGRMGLDECLIEAQLATPAGLLKTNMSSGLLLGAQGRYGIITDAKLRLRQAPEKNLNTAYLYPDLQSALASMRSAIQSGLNIELHLSDDEETRVLGHFSELGKKSGFLSRLQSLHLLPQPRFENPCRVIAIQEGHAPKISFEKKCFERIARRYGAYALGQAEGGAFKNTRFQSHYLRDSLLERAIGVEHFDVWAPWSKIASTHEHVRNVVLSTLTETAPREGAKGLALSHITPSSTDGANLRVTAIFPRAIGSELEQADKIALIVRAAMETYGSNIRPNLADSPLLKDARNALKQSLDPQTVLPK